MSLTSENFKSLAEAVGATLDSSGRAMTLQSGAIRVFTATGKNPKLVIEETSAAAAPLPKISLVKETAFHRFGKRIGVNREVQTGDAIFDQNVYVQDFVPEEVTKELLSNERARNAVLYLVNVGFDIIKFSENGLALEKSIDDDIESISPEVFAESIGAFEILVHSVPAFDKSALPRPHDTFPQKVVAILGAMIAIVFSLRFIIDDIPMPIESVASFAFKAACIAWPACILVLTRILRGYHDSLSSLCICSALMFVLLFGGIYVTIRSTNGYFDKSPSISHSQIILKKKAFTGGKGPAQYFLTVTSWRTQESQLDIRVHSKYFKSVAEGSPITIITRSGALGWEWVVTCF